MLIKVYSDTINFAVNFHIDNEGLAISLKRFGIDDRTSLPIYQLTCHLDNSLLPNGNYIVTDIAMSMFITIVTNLIKKYLIFQGTNEESIEIKYYNTSQEETKIPLFVSDNTQDAEIDVLIRRQIQFGSLWEDFQHPDRNMIWEDTIEYLVGSDYLVDFLCLVNIERKISIPLI